LLGHSCAQHDVIGVLGECLQGVERVLEVVEDAEEEHEPVPLTRQEELRVEVDLDDVDRAGEVRLQCSSASQLVEVRRRVLHDVDLVAERCEQPGEIAVGGTDVGHG